MKEICCAAQLATVVGAEAVADRIRFHQSTIEDAQVQGLYDLVTAFECLHDMPYPVQET